MAQAHYVTQQLQAVDPGCCPLCNSALPTQGIFYTPDFAIFVRDGQLAQFSPIEAGVMRELFKQATAGFRLLRSRLVENIYAGTVVPLSADNTVSIAMTKMRPKLLPLGMGLITDNGTTTLLFTPPGYRRK